MKLTSNMDYYYAEFLTSQTNGDPFHVTYGHLVTWITSIINEANKYGVVYEPYLVWADPDHRWATMNAVKDAMDNEPEKPDGKDIDWADGMPWIDGVPV